MHGRRDEDIVRTTHNTARFFTETRHVSWVMLIFTLVWGAYGYFSMPQRKDPDIPLRVAAASITWPGASAEKIEQLVTRRVEETIAGNPTIDKITSNTRTSTGLVIIELQKQITEPGKQFDDIKLKLDGLKDLPQGASIKFIKDFGDTATLLLTVASPRVAEVEIALRAREVRQALDRTRPAGAGDRVALVVGFPKSVPPRVVRPPFLTFGRYGEEAGAVRDVRFFEGPGFVGMDAASSWDDARLLGLVDTFVRERLRASELHPDLWRPFTIRDPGQLEARLAASAGDRYSYRELKDHTDLIKRTLLAVPVVAKVEASGVLPEQVYLDYSQERLASYGVKTSALSDILEARNITLPGGMLEVGDKNMRIDPSGEFQSEQEIGDVLIPVADGRGALYLRDIADVVRAYQSPARYLNFFSHRAADGSWPRTRAVTLSIQMRAGEQINNFGERVDTALDDLKKRLPDDLILARTSDQPRQVEENIHLFMASLYEAIILVVLVSLIGFWEWRSALLMALAIPITLAMTFGMMHMLGIDLQQVSIASLIIALGLLVDDPVVAGDAIKRSLADGQPPVVAAWLGPTKLATAILYATITNIVAYLPFLLLSGDNGRFMYSLPVVIACSLVASRIVSMTFIPLLGYYLLRPKAEPSIEERRKSGFASWYYRIGTRAIEHRWRFAAAALVFLVLGGAIGKQLKQQYFPKDLQYLSYVDVWLPEDAPLLATQRKALEAEAIVREVAGDKLLYVTTCMRMEERARLSDVQNLYVFSSQGSQKVPLQALSTIGYGLATEKLQRRNQFRTITVSAFPMNGRLSSEVLMPLKAKIEEYGQSLPPGYTLEIGGEYEKQVEGFGELAVVMLISVIMIFLALVVQFKHAIKPIIVFAAIPFGMVGGLAGLWIMGAPFGFTGFLGMASLVGVIVSHVIVLFDFIEEKHAEGEPLEQALLDAGIMRLRPVLITVGATVIALFPLAAHGGPLWEPLCYAQIGGLTVATFVTLLLVPVIYAIFVLDLKLVKWEGVETHAAVAPAHPAPTTAAAAGPGGIGGLPVRVEAGVPDRNYPALFLALDDVLEALGEGRPDDDALQRSFEGSADGFGAEKALLLMVDDEQPPRRLRALASRGLSPEEVAACESGRSVPGVSSSRIREAIDGRVPVMVQDPELLLGANVTEALRGQPCSVLCAPMCDPRTGRALAVLYVQNHGVRNAFGEIDRAWIEVYARALGRCLASMRERQPASPTTTS